MEQTQFPSIAHCAMYIIHNNKDWTNKKIADEVSRVMGSRTGPGNISWYKGKLKKGELNIESYLNPEIKIEKPVAVVEPVIDENSEIEIPAELIVNEEDIIKASGIQKTALIFCKDRSNRNFGLLYERLKPGMLHHANSILKDGDASEDVVSIAFTKIWLKIDQYNKFWNFSTWAYKIVHHESLQYIRKNKVLVSMDGPKYGGVKTQNTEHNLLYNGADEELISVDPNWDLDESDEMHQAVYSKVLAEINNLSKFYKNIMIDRELNGMKYKEISEKYGININSVKTRIKRARMQIIENNPDYEKLVNAKKKKIRHTDEETQFNESDDFARAIGTDLFDIL